MNNPLPHDHPEFLEQSMTPAHHPMPTQFDVPSLVHTILILIAAGLMGLAIALLLDVIQYSVLAFEVYQMLNEARTNATGEVCRRESIDGVWVEHCVRTTLRL